MYQYVCSAPRVLNKKKRKLTIEIQAEIYIYTNALNIAIMTKPIIVRIIAAGITAKAALTKTFTIETKDMSKSTTRTSIVFGNSTDLWVSGPDDFSGIVGMRSD